MNAYYLNPNDPVDRRVVKFGIIWFEREYEIIKDMTEEEAHLYFRSLKEVGSYTIYMYSKQ